MLKHQVTAAIDRAHHALAALRATESLISQIDQLQDSGSDLSLLLSLITEILGKELDEISDKIHSERVAA